MVIDNVSNLIDRLLILPKFPKITEFDLNGYTTSTKWTKTRA